ncbi:MAG: MmgE/PrpD family protein [Nitriliruptoraceae bacterium]
MGEDPATLSEQLAAFAVSTLVGGAPSIVRDSVRQRVLDVLGLQAAALPLDTSAAALRFVTAQGGAPQSHVVGQAEAVPAPWAAFANGVLAHSLDYDDTHLPSVLHPSASVVPAGLAAAELHGASGPLILDAIGVGIETVVRLGMAGYDRETGDSVYFAHGQHATSICGAIGSAVTAALLADLGERGVVDTIGVAASMASGILEANRTGGTVKRMHCGWAAHAGVTAAALVEAGFTGPPTALEGRFGFFEAFLHGTVDHEEVTRGLGDEWAVPGIFFKPYPANHFTHTGLDAARRLRARGLRPDDVEEAVLGVAAPTVRTIGEPLEVKQRPETGYQAQFSGPYLVAVGLLGGSGLGAGLVDFTDELVRDPVRRDLMSRIRVEADERCDAIYPYQFPAVLRVRTRDGGVVTEEVLVNRGGPGDPLSDVELVEKFRGNAGQGYGPDAASAVEEAVAGLSAGTHDATDVIVPFGLVTATRVPTTQDR